MIDAANSLAFRSRSASAASRRLSAASRASTVGFRAVGRLHTGSQRILDIRAEKIHQRVPLVIGSAEDVALYEEFYGVGASYGS